MTDIEVKIINQLSDNYSYVIYSTKSKNAIVVDPSESNPIKSFLIKNDLNLQAILITHHHSDHTSGIKDLLVFKKIKVFTPNSQIIGTSDLINDKDNINFEFIDFQIIATPGHTLDHIVYYNKNNNLLFCGDTLFSLGCGRIFEGNYKQMFSSLQTLNKLPDNTLVYCGHEYTFNNYNFLNSIFLNHKELAKYKKIIDERFIKKKCTVPFRLGDEKIVNPFLASNINAYHKFMLANKFDKINFFKYLRSLKDSY